MLIYFCDELSSEFLLLSDMRRHESLVGGDESDSFSAGYRGDVLVADIPRPGWLGEEFDIRNIVHRIDYSLELDLDELLLSFLRNLEILDESVLLEQFEHLHFEVGESDVFDGSLPRHICVLDPDEKIMDRSVNIGHVYRYD